METQKLDPGLRSVLLNMIYVITDDEPRQLSPSYQTLFDKQMNLGVRSIFLGFFLDDWINIQHKFLEINNLPRKQQQARHAMVIINNALWSHVHALWMQRNAQLHQPPPDSNPSFKRITLIERVQQLYQQSTNILHSDQRLFATPLEDKLRLPDHALRLFVASVTPIVKRSLKDAKDKLSESNRKISSFLQRPRIPDHILDIIRDP